jgi:hypothetical protein
MVTSSRPAAPLSVILRSLAEDSARERVSFGDLLNALGDRALGALLFVFAAPNVLPVPPGTSALLGAPLVFLAAQLTIGRGPWLPAAVSKRSLSQADFKRLVRRIEPRLASAESLLRPRLTLLAGAPMQRMIGLLCLVLALVLFLPIPLGNMLPGLAITVLALGLLGRDGAWILGGLAVAGVALVVVSGVVFALFKAALYLATHVLH